MTAIVGGEQHAVARTTPEAIDLQRTFADMLAAGDDAVVMEVSSHALALHRADAIHWSAAVFTNLTQDHLDFHADMEDYFLAKRRLFEAGPELAVITSTIPTARRLAGELPGAIRIGLDAANAQVRAPHPGRRRRRLALRGRRARAAHPAPRALQRAQRAWPRSSSPARWASTTRRSRGALPRAGRVPGRFEPVDEGQGFAVLVDYAHTPDSLENVLRAAREIAERPRDRRRSAPAATATAPSAR